MSLLPPPLMGMKQAGNAPSSPLKIRDVETVQKKLKNLGYYEGPIDNKIGPKTEAGIKGFQKAKGLKVDGIIGAKTWSELRIYLDPSASREQRKNDRTNSY